MNYDCILLNSNEEKVMAGINMMRISIRSGNPMSMKWSKWFLMNGFSEKKGKIDINSMDLQRLNEM